MRMDRLALATFLVSLTTLCLLVRYVYEGGAESRLQFLHHHLPRETERKSCNSTIVTAYYRIPSKHTHDEYTSWMINFLTLRDCMVVFSSPDMLSLVTALRPPSYPTLLLPRPFQSFRSAELLDEEGWSEQEMMDRERSVGHNRKLYWIWNEKTEMMKIASDINPFSSSYFLWLDIGSVKGDQYNYQLMVKTVPQEKGVLLLQVASFTPDEISNKDEDGASLADFSSVNRIGGGAIGCDKESLSSWHSAYYSTVRQYLARGRFIGKDQSMMATVCLQTNLCLLVEGDGDWFMMQKVLRGEGGLEYKRMEGTHDML